MHRLPQQPCLAGCGGSSLRQRMLDLACKSGFELAEDVDELADPDEEEVELRAELAALTAGSRPSCPALPAHRRHRRFRWSWSGPSTSNAPHGTALKDHPHNTEVGLPADRPPSCASEMCCLPPFGVTKRKLTERAWKPALSDSPIWDRRVASSCWISPSAAAAGAGVV